MNNHYANAFMALESKRIALICKQSQAIYNHSIKNGASYDFAVERQAEHITKRKLFTNKSKVNER
jgi:hypothetical protein